MELGRLDHVNIRTARLDEMVRWYGEVLGMPAGERPPFEMPGAWLYAGDLPIVHLVGAASVEGAADPGLEHFAIRAKGLASLVARLKDKGVAYSIDEVPTLPIVQVNFCDPDGNRIHVDFDAFEMADFA